MPQLCKAGRGHDCSGDLPPLQLSKEEFGPNSTYITCMQSKAKLLRSWAITLNVNELWIVQQSSKSDSVEVTVSNNWLNLDMAQNLYPQGR